MNPSTALARVLVDELLQGVVREAVLSPGSRNAPLAFALHAADAAGLLRLHVRIDERTAGFLALGLAKRSGLPVPVVTTSGTATANLHPAVVEAEYSGVPLVVLTADRPVELRGVGANQTIDQTRLYGVSTPHFTELSVDTHPDEPAQRRAVQDALAAATGPARPGPVHLNVALREPLTPSPADTPTWTPLPAALRERSVPGVGQRLAPGPRTVVVAGDRAGSGARALAEAAGWPLLAEPSSGARGGPNALTAYRLLLGLLGDDIERVVVLGRPTLSRPVARLLADDGVEVVRPTAGEPAPTVDGPGDRDWLHRWLDADALADDAVTQVLTGEPPTGLAVAQAVAAATPPDGLLVAGSSSAVRDLDLAHPWDVPPAVLANRGASGIDGTVSTAIGAALAHQRGEPGTPAYALLGDLTFLHDSTGLVVGPGEPRPDLTLVVVNDDGGGLFTLLEQGAPEHAAVFERVFATPHGVDLQALCAASATPYARATDLDELRRALAEKPSGVRVVEVPTDRSRTRDLHARLAAAVAAALAG